MTLTTTLELPELCLVVLVGVSGSGKTTFARKHFEASEILSSDFCRGLVANDENDQNATGDAFDVLHYIAGKRLGRGHLTVIDATSVQSESRKGLVKLARAHDCLAVAIVINVGTNVAVGRNANRVDRELSPRVVRQQHSQLRNGLRGLKREGFSRVHILDSVEEVEAVSIQRRKLWNDRRHESGPFDLIGDVHGCREELCDLLGTLGYSVWGPREAPKVTAPQGRRALFLGDLVDRGPDSPGVLRLVMSMVESGAAICIPGNHEIKLLRKLRGKNVKLTHGLAETVEQLAAEPAEFSEQVATFIDRLVSHYVLDKGRLVVAHAGLPEVYQGRASGRVRSFCLYGETTGETDAFGLPVRYDWASEYRGRAAVVYGHTPVPEAEWVNHTICIDTGCVFGGKLTALRYPERELVSVQARRVHYEPSRPLEKPTQRARPAHVLDVSDVSGKRIIDTRLRHSVTIRAGNAAAALEVMSRFAVDPRWLVYLPPTMSPAQTAPVDSEALERPEEAFAYFAAGSVSRVVCQEKHMGSRAVVVLARSKRAAYAKFGVTDGKQGVIYTRTGRPFFSSAEVERQLVARVAAAFEAAELWDELGTEWVCLDAELMPWSLKAVELLRTQYAAVGASGRASLAAAVESLDAAQSRGSAELLRRYRQRQQMVEDYSAAWRRYCWSAETVDQFKLAPFHLMATEGTTHVDRPHGWHMETLARLAKCEPIIAATPYRLVDLEDPHARAEAVTWWEQLTADGGEGMVVKPEHWIVHGKRGLVQPAVKCRGREYLRVIYGPEYTAPEHIERLRKRGLSTKRSLALREFALGLEGLYRFVEGEPLWRVHECVFGVLALETEPVDPRL